MTEGITTTTTANSTELLEEAAGLGGLFGDASDSDSDDERAAPAADDDPIEPMLAGVAPVDVPDAAVWIQCGRTGSARAGRQPVEPVVDAAPLKCAQIEGVHIIKVHLDPGSGCPKAAKDVHRGLVLTGHVRVACAGC